jgi:hypothetical protein
MALVRTSEQGVGRLAEGGHEAAAVPGAGGEHGVILGITAVTVRPSPERPLRASRTWGRPNAVTRSGSRKTTIRAIPVAVTVGTSTSCAW